MYGHLGFSYMGCIYLLMLFIPNIIWTKFKPEGYEKIAANENKVLLIFEKAGQVLVTTFTLIFSDNLKPFSLWSIWLFCSMILMILYEIYWVKYFKSRRELSDFYGRFLGIPLPGATLPVVAFMLLGIYKRVIWLILSSIILGIGHIGIHLQHKREI